MDRLWSAPAADLLPEAGLGVGQPLRLDLGPSAWLSASLIYWESKEITSRPPVVGRPTTGGR